MCNLSIKTRNSSQTKRCPRVTEKSREFCFQLEVHPESHWVSSWHESSSSPEEPTSRPGASEGFFVQTHTVPRNITVICNITDLLQHLTFPRETSQTAGLDRSCEMLWTHFWSPGDLWSTNWPSPPVFWPGPIACVTRSCCEPYLPHITICMLDGQGCISTVTLFPFYPTSPGAQSMDEQLPAPSVLTKQGGFCTRYVRPSTASMENKYIHTHQA